ncbi:MAG: hypothetical protein ACRDFX_07455 [Chloroflexota bacterium]
MATAGAASSSPVVLTIGVRGRGLLIGTVTLVYIVILLANLRLLLLPPRFALDLSQSSTGSSRVVWVLPGSLLWDRGARVGDRVLAVDGRAAIRESGGLRFVTEVTVQGAHGIVRFSAAALRRGRVTWPLMALSPWFLIFGTLIVLRSTRPQVGKAAYALFASAAFALALAAGADGDDPFMAAAELIAIPAFALAFVHFFLTFPNQRVVRGRARLIAAPALAAAALGLVPLLWSPLYRPLSAVRVTIVSAYLAIGTGLLIWGFMRTRSREARQGLIILNAGAVISVLPLLALSLAPRLFGWHALVPPEEAALVLALLPVSFAYAILRHDIKGVSLWQRWLVRGVLWGLFALLAAGVVLVLHFLRATQLGAPEIGIGALLLVLGGASFHWAYSRLLAHLDRLIFKDGYDYRASLQRLSADLSLTGDLDAVSKSLPQTLAGLMNLRFVVLLAYEGALLRVQGVAGSPEPATVRELIGAAHSESELNPALTADDDHPVLLMPLLLGGSVVGWLCLGPKSSGEPIRGLDRDLLTTLRGHLAAVIGNAQLASDLRLKVRARCAQRTA